jgi:hypothetical protein
VLVQQFSPAARLKRRPQGGDIITTIDGRAIKDGDDLVNEITSRRPGSTIRLGYLRDGKPADTTVTIGDRDKVFAEQGNQQAEAEPALTTRATPARPSWAWWSAQESQPPPPSCTPRRGHPVGPLRLVCRPAGT